MVWVGGISWKGKGRTLRILLPWAPFTKSGCSEPHPAWPWPFPGMERDGEGEISEQWVPLQRLHIPTGAAVLSPGYLCLYMEKDELLGATLMLAWVPNARIRRQDEEALRYVTPEGSPVRKAPRKRGRAAPQGPGTASPPGPGGGSEGLSACQPPPRDAGPSAEGEKLPQSGARSAPGTPSTLSSLEEPCRSEGTEEGLDCREDEGSLELSADDVSRDSTFDSDSDAFSSPFCLSPISEALGKSSSSVFMDSESR